jgi:polysaccharide export outer membrane protein
MLALALGACAASYRFDTLDRSDGVEPKDLEALITDSQRASAPGERLGLKKTILQFDFTRQVDEYRIGRNDVLNVFVVDHPEMSSQRVNLGEISGTVVQKDGFVYLPVIGKVQADGLTVVEFTDSLRKSAAAFIVAPQVSVDVLRYGSQKFYVLGQVTKPGAFSVDGDTTLLEGLGFAGGTTPEADLEGAYVLRGGQLLPVSLADILLRGDVERNVLMRDKDVVFVPDSADKKVFVLGEVSRPSVVPIQRERITLAEALAAAGGPTITHARSEISVLRGGNARPTVYTVDMRQALLYDDRIGLRPGDRVIVAPTGLSTASRYMQQILPFLQAGQSAAQGTESVINIVPPP